MTTVTYTNFRQNMTHFLDKADNDCEAIVITRSKGRNSVVIPMDEYQSLMETAYLLSTEANRKNLDRAKAEIKAGKGIPAPF